jgi:hypothetical protein
MQSKMRCGFGVIETPPHPFFLNSPTLRVTYYAWIATGFLINLYFPKRLFDKVV